MRCIAALVCMLAASTALAQVELKNDGFSAGGQVAYQSGFCTNEAAASRFIAPEGGRQLLKIRFLFGDTAVTKSVTVVVWDDTAGTNTPGMELFRGDYQVTGSNNGIVESDMSNLNILVPSQFRVGIVTQYRGLPFVARDNDMTGQDDFPDRNFLLADASCDAGGPYTWYQASTLGVQGDWVIRAEISSSPGTPTDAGAPDSGAGGPPVGDPCQGNAQCPIGQYCNLSAMVCTSDCASDDQCGGGTCNSLGQCVPGGEGGGGCGCQGGDDGTAVLALGLVIVFVRRRRQHQR